jgi:hypothetical protein
LLVFANCIRITVHCGLANPMGIVEHGHYNFVAERGKIAAYHTFNQYIFKVQILRAFRQWLDNVFGELSKSPA